MPATIDDVARLAGVSTATVSRALRGLPNVAPATRDRVARAANLLDYVPDPAASALAAGRTNVIGVVVPTIGRWSHARILEVVSDIATTAGLDVLPVMLASPAARDFFLTSHPFRRRVDGLVVAEVPLDVTDVARLAEGRPVATIGLELDDVDTVLADEQAGVAAATRHLLDLGHTDITFIGDTDSTATLVGPRRRREGFESVLAAAGHPTSGDRVVETQPTATGGAAAMTLLLEQPRPPTAVITASDEMALGAMEVARARGLSIPGDLSVVGLDDQPIAQYVGLTTVARDVTRMATVAADWVVAAVAAMETPGEGVAAVPARHRMVRTSLVVRRSTGPPAMVVDDRDGDSRGDLD
ncbi:MAG TPA: LacI family DNA-binding transcriptional regulator [Nitriliruptoraceae bacterium]|nr:LacI family DNA-binding transcriptional regulator [Nitriliruptoraceae bacterium]